MILLILIQGIVALQISVFSLLPDLPNLPDAVISGVNAFLDIIFDNVGILGLFIPINTVKIVVPLVIAIANFDRIYKLVMWIIRKVPFLDIS